MGRDGERKNLTKVKETEYNADEGVGVERHTQVQEYEEIGREEFWGGGGGEVPDEVGGGHLTAPPLRAAVTVKEETAAFVVCQAESPASPMTWTISPRVERLHLSLSLSPTTLSLMTPFHVSRS